MMYNQRVSLVFPVSLWDNIILSQRGVQTQSAATMFRSSAASSITARLTVTYLPHDRSIALTTRSVHLALPTILNLHPSTCESRSDQPVHNSFHPLGQQMQSQAHMVVKSSEVPFNPQDRLCCCYSCFYLI
jgi:hypothetical protein